MHFLHSYIYHGLQDNFLFPKMANGAEVPNPAKSGPSHPGNGPPGPPDDGPNIPGRQGDGPPIHNN